jgi:hypothetical protein
VRDGEKPVSVRNQLGAAVLLACPPVFAVHLGAANSKLTGPQDSSLWMTPQPSMLGARCPVSGNVQIPQ